MYFTPKLVESLIGDGVYAKQVHLSKERMAVLTTEGEVLTAGSGSYGRLGNFEMSDQLYLEPVELLAYNVKQIAGGKAFTIATRVGGGMIRDRCVHACANDVSCFAVKMD